MAEKRSIPELRDRLREIAQQTVLRELSQIADEMAWHPVVTSDMAEDIRQFAWNHPERPLRDVAHHFHVTPGRVSEALYASYRFDN